MKRDEYREVYLRSEHWLTTRKAALQRAEHRCQVCNSTKQLDVHHRTYERLGEERDADLTVLCRRCHDLFHNGTRQASSTKTGRRRAKKAARESRNRAANQPIPSPDYVSPSERERYDKMRAAELERRRQTRIEQRARKREIEDRRRANAKSRSWRDERELPRKAA